MRNLKICIAYNGSAYHGWQRQNNNITVQQLVEDCMSRIMNSKITAHGCSRTDAGVHAREFCLNARTDSAIPCPGLMRAMNKMLPDDIAVLSCEDADEDFHARFSAHGKEYIYIVNNAPHKDVFGSDLALFYPYPLDEKRLDAAAKLFTGTHDFSAFCKAEAKQHLRSTVRTVRSFDVSRSDDTVTFTVSGDGFLHNMVRIMVGTLIYLNEGKRTEADIIRSLETGERTDAGITIPPHGLYLNKVFYN
ncbi:MAG TPA: tRNA pseudouridine(38-40) synthase TruA [Ruminococcaceae bacterium]|nr:tRNA pseudouridine(38-40) synthase TruA [Oscillospiraceae bacterium]